MLTQQQIEMAFLMLSSVWTREDITEGRIAAYRAALDDLTWEQVEPAIVACLKSSTFFPVPAEIRAKVVAAAVPEISRGEAWEEVRKQVSRHGFVGYRNWQFTSPVIGEAVRHVGARRICLDDDSRGFIRRDFEQALTACADRQRAGLQAGTVAIGEPTEAAKVIAFRARDTA